VPANARRGLAKAGFAVIGFTDFVNRSVVPGGDTTLLNDQVFTVLINRHALPDYLSLLTIADQLALVRMIPTLKSVDVLPLGAPDGKPDLAPSLPLGYLGFSQGATHGMGLLPFAPEIRTAVLAAGAGRYSAYLVHQYSDALYGMLVAAFPGLTRAEFYTSIALVQMAFDSQDPQNLARFLYRQPLALGTSSRAHVLLVEGLGDHLVPFYSLRSGASQLLLPQIEPRAEVVPFLDAAGASSNEGSGVATKRYFQYVPAGYAVTPTPGCVAQHQLEGHFCAQLAPEAIEQRVRFFEAGQRSP
jgi:hypothetical protein